MAQVTEYFKKISAAGFKPVFKLILFLSKHLKGQLGTRVGDVTFFNHGGQLGPCVGDVTFFNNGGQLGPCVGDVT